MKKPDYSVHGAERKAYRKTLSAKRYPLNAIIFLFSIFGCCVMSLTGCETLKEGAKGFLGISTRALEENRKSAIVKTFDYDYFTSYTKSLDIIKIMRCYIYSQDIKKHMIAFYISETDTTPVGVFFKEIDAKKTQIEVSSQSTYAKEFISAKLFGVLDNKVTLEDLKAQIDAKELEEAKQKEAAKSAY